MTLTAYRLIQALSDGRFHSGEVLARDLGISRAAVWKHLQRLRETLEVDVQAVSGRGYRVARPLELLAEGEIMAALSGGVRAQISSLVLHHQIDSTNSWLLEQADPEAPCGTVCLSGQQTAGRGRRGRSWISPFGSNIYLSILWRYALAPVQLSGLSLAAGLAVVRALAQLGIRGMGLKWPNDVIADGRKLAGLLLEVMGEADGPSLVVVGVGVNVRMSERQGADIDQPWIDVARLGGAQDCSRNRLAALLIENLVMMLRAFETQGLKPLLDEWRRYDLLHGKRVTLISGGRSVEGIHRGVDAQGALLLAQGDAIRAYHAGEISLRSNA